VRLDTRAGFCGCANVKFERLWRLVRIFCNGLSDLGSSLSLRTIIAEVSSVQMYDGAMIAVVMTVDVA
jgi:hypothetical protein